MDRLCFVLAGAFIQRAGRIVRVEFLRGLYVLKELKPSKNNSFTRAEECPVFFPIRSFRVSQQTSLSSARLPNFERQC